MLSKLDETIPDSVDIRVIGAMLKQTGEALNRISDDDLVNMQEKDSMLPSVLKFYQILVSMSRLYCQCRNILLHSPLIAMLSFSFSSPMWKNHK